MIERQLEPGERAWITTYYKGKHAPARFIVERVLSSDEVVKLILWEDGEESISSGPTTHCFDEWRDCMSECDRLNQKEEQE